ncbi:MULTISPECIES: merozoite surface protein 3b [Gilliamella]|uniref:Merozoite surface protein 3b n=1 Tax=Gilliamella apis TaxID=1970738 RepID=A0A242NX61_9GAMM|nr:MULTISPECIES: merozoite surface protein 3b [Gilliamella]MBI0153464.1 merozoite surface protein 3b [Gilliamella sp. W8128]OCG03506.1 merozoite surface protein 3b [Gilliamella apis]OTQ35816.1 merozoite surface protein 3b [Gilliamella apis]OTQ37434.1 merozoite surface protein 3b [Gilliamella apis]OTQ39659.1 merozoite surface protein 3b [Gilliamella apis]
MSSQVIPYIDRAVQLLNKIGIIIKPQADAPILKLLDNVAEIDKNRVIAIARTLQQQSAFNQVVREQIDGVEVSQRYTKIVNHFDSIRTDMEKMLGWLDDGRLDFFEKIKIGWMKLQRGSIPDRFNLIKKTYLQVSQETGNQIEREHIILNAYQDFRFGLKQAQITAEELVQIATARLEECKDKLSLAINDVDNFKEDDHVAKARLELIRDEALRNVQQEDNRYQIILDLANNLTVSYNSAEAVFARIQQTTSVKERVYQQSVSFFSTNEIVFTALSASITSLTGLSESTKTLEAMKDGMNKGIESIASAGNKQLEESLRAGYSSTIKADSLRALVDAIVNYQESSQQLIIELRNESIDNAKEIDRIVEDGKQRFNNIILKANN